MLARHSLVWLDEAGWRQVSAGLPEHWLAAVEQWQQSDWPLVVRRRDPEAAPGELCLGLAQPPDPIDGIKRRLPLRVHESMVRRTQSPLLLAEALDAAPDHWRPVLEALAAEAADDGIALRVFGSLALQALTGARYLTPGSDIDLLFYPRNEPMLADGIWLLSRFATRLPLDGEVGFPGGDAVSWKEWANAIAAHGRMRVLVKGAHDVRLERPEMLLASLRRDDA